MGALAIRGDDMNAGFRDSTQPGGYDRARPGRPLLSVTHDGTVVARLRRRPQRQFPWGLLIKFLLVGAVMKILLYADMGPAAYGAKAAELREGNLLEKAAGHAMIMDPVSRSLIDSVVGLAR